MWVVISKDKLQKGIIIGLKNLVQFPQSSDVCNAMIETVP